MKESRLVLYDFEWQELRTLLNFSTLAMTQWSLEVLRKYLREGDLNRVWRVMNLLAATRMGFSGLRKLIKSSERLRDLRMRDTVVKQEHRKLSEELERLISLNKRFVVALHSELVDDIQKADFVALHRVHGSLSDRYARSDQSINRPELKYYLGLLDHEISTREKGLM